MCKDCPKRDKCKKPCPEVEKVLDGLNHSLKSNYLVKFVDPLLLEATASTESYEMSPYKKRKTYKVFAILDKKIGTLPRLRRLCLCHYYGLRGESPKSQPDIAKVLGVSQNTVSYHLVQAKLKLRLKMAKIR